MTTDYQNAIVWCVPCGTTVTIDGTHSNPDATMLGERDPRRMAVTLVHLDCGHFGVWRS